MEHYIYIKSNESDEYFEDNKTYRIKVQLSLPLYLPGSWKVALVDFHASEKTRNKSKADDGIYIYSDLCKESIVYGEERPLLRRLEKNAKGKWDFIFDNPFYVPVKKKEVRVFQIYIKRESDDFATELIKPVYLTLHLKRYPFL